MPLDGMERRRFESGDPTPGRSQDFLVTCPVWASRYCSLFRRRKTAARARLSLIRGDEGSNKIGGRVPADNKHQLRRLSPYLFSKPVYPLCTGSSETFIFYAECSHSTQEVSEWRCHRHEYRPDL